MDPKLYEEIATGKSPIPNLDSNTAQLTCGQGNKIIHIAVKYGNVLATEHILRSHPQLAFEPNSKGDTALHIAARSEHNELANLLLDHYEEYRNDVALEAGESHPLRLVNNVGNNVLHEAVKNGRLGIVKRLVEMDRSLGCFRNERGESVIFVAADRGYCDTALCVLESFPNCSIFGRNGMTVMHAAVIRREDDLVREILKKCGPEILEIADNFGWMPLHYAAQLGRSEAVEVILKTTSSLAYIKDNQGMSPLHISARSGKANVAKRLIEARPDICELLNFKGQTALHVAVDHRQKNMIKALLKNLAFEDLINEQDLEGNTALHVAAIRADFEVLQMFALDERVDKEIVNNMELTAFDIFCESTIELTRIEKRFMSVLERYCIIKSLKTAYTSESLPTPILNSSPGNDTISRRNDNAKTTSEYWKNMANINLVIATLVVGVTFAAGVQMPGAYNDDGIANLKGKYNFSRFLIYNSLAFGCAAASLLTYFASSIFSRMFQFMKPKRRSTETLDVTVVMMLTAFSVLFAVGAFMHATSSVLDYNSPKKYDPMYWTLSVPAIVVPVLVLTVYFVYQFVPLNLIRPLLRAGLRRVKDEGFRREESQLSIV